MSSKLQNRAAIPNIQDDDLLLIADQSDAYIVKKALASEVRNFINKDEILFAYFPNVGNNATVTLSATSIVAVYEQRVVSSVSLWFRVNYEITRPLDGSLLHSIKKTTTAGTQNVRVEYY
jgi:hypothetical protein